MAGDFAYKTRIEALVVLINKYDSKFVIEDLNRALRMAGHSSKSRKKNTDINNWVSDPLDILETLLANEKPDRETILAAVLYPSLLPKGKNWVGDDQLAQVGKVFGTRVRHIVEDTLSLWSLLPLPAQTQDPRDNKRDFKLMGLLVARSRSAIMIRAAQAFTSVKEILYSTSREEQERIRNHIDVIADLAYVARFPNLRNAILNQKLRLSQPLRYREIRQQIHSTYKLNERGDKLAKARGEDEFGRIIYQSVKEQVTPEDIAAIKTMMTETLEHELGGEENYAQELRPKEPHATGEKTDRKEQAVEQLGDLWGGRTIIEQSYIEAHFPYLPERQKKREEKKQEGGGDVKKKEKVPASPEQNACEKLYYALSRKFGRHSSDPIIKEVFAELASLDPNSADPTKDDRFDNYYRNPKASGYRAIQDSLVFVVNDKVIIVEWQIVARKDHKVNTDDQPSHRLYKTDMLPYKEIVDAWEKVADQIDDKHGNRLNVPVAAVYKSNNDIAVVIGETETRCRAIDFVRQNFDYLQEEYPELETPDDIVGVFIDNSNPLMKRQGDIPYGLSMALRSGDRITGLSLRSSLEGGPGS